MGKEDMVSLLNSFNLNKPLDVSLVFDDSDDENISSNNQDIKSAHPTQLNLNAPLEVTLVFDETDYLESPNKKNKLNDNDKDSCTQNTSDEKVIVSEWFKTTPDECKTKSSLEKYIKVNNQQNSLEIRPKTLNVDKASEVLVIKDDIKNKNSKKIHKNKDPGNKGKTKQSNFHSKTKFEACSVDKKVVNRKDCLKSQRSDLGKPLENSSITDKSHVLNSSKKNNPENKEQSRNAYQNEINCPEMGNGKAEKQDEAVLENGQIDGQKQCITKPSNVMPEINYYIHPKNNISNSNCNTPIRTEVNVGEKSNIEHMESPSIAITVESSNNIRSQQSISQNDVNKDYNTQNSVNNEYVDCDNYLTLMLKTVTEHLIVILQAYNCLVSSKYPEVTEIDPNKVSEAENNFQKIKEHFYNLSYSTVANIMLPQEKNTQFVQKFITDCVALSKNQFQYNQFQSVYNDLLQWVKIKKKYISELPFGKSFESLQSANPILADQLSQPLQVPVIVGPCDRNKPNDNVIHEKSSISQNPSLCIFSSNSNAGKITINVDTHLLQRQIQENQALCSSASVNSTSTVASNISVEHSQKSEKPSPSAAEFSQQFVNGISKNTNSTLPTSRPSPYPQHSQLHSVRMARHGLLSNPGADSQQTGFNATPYFPQVVHRPLPPYSSTLMHPANYTPISSYVVRQPSVCHSSMAQQKKLPFQKTHNLYSNNYLYTRQMPPKSLQTAKTTITQSKPQECNFSSSQVWYPANYNSLAHTTGQAPLSKVQNFVNNLPANSQASASSIPTMSSPIYWAPPPAYNSPSSPQINSTWQKTHDFESIEEHNKSTRCQSTDSGFASPFNLQSPTEAPAPIHQQNPLPPPTPLITHVTSLNPNAAHNNDGICYICHKTTKLKCLGCHKVYYCSYNCQVKDWGRHERVCKL